MAKTNATVTWHDWTYCIEGERGAGYEVTRRDDRSDEPGVSIVGRAASLAAAKRMMLADQRTLAALYLAVDLV